MHIGIVGPIATLDIAHLIERALQQALEPECYAQLSREGCTVAHTRFSTAHVVDQFYHLYAQAPEDDQASIAAG